MKKIKSILIICLLVILCTSCKSSNLKSLSFSELNKKLDNKETFFFVIIQDGCQHCEKFVPVVEDVLDEYNLVGYKINITSLSEEDDDALFEMYGVNSTPTTIFIKDGKELSILQRIEGSVSSEKLINKLKANNYIK